MSSFWDRCAWALCRCIRHAGLNLQMLFLAAFALAFFADGNVHAAEARGLATEASRSPASNSTHGTQPSTGPQTGGPRQVECPEALFDQVFQRDKSNGWLGSAMFLDQLGKDHKQGTTVHENCSASRVLSSVESPEELEGLLTSVAELDLGNSVQAARIAACVEQVQNSSELSSRDKQAAIADYVYLMNRLKQGSKANMEGVAGIDRLLGGPFLQGYPDQFNSQIPKSGDYLAQLKNTPACREKAPDSEMQLMVTQTQHAMKALAELRKRRADNQQRSGRANGTVVVKDAELEQKLEKSIRAIETAFPWLVSPAFEDIVDSQHPQKQLPDDSNKRNGRGKPRYATDTSVDRWTDDAVQSRLVQHLKDSREAMIKQTQDFQKASECIHGNKKGCLREHLTSLASAPEINASKMMDLALADKSLSAEKVDKLGSAYIELSGAACRQGFRELKRDAADVANSTVVNVALTAATFGASAYAMAAIRGAQAVAAAGGRTLSIYQASSKIPNVAKAAFATSIGIDASWVGPSGKDALEQCAKDIPLAAQRKGGSVDFNEDGLATLKEPTAPQDFNKISCEANDGLDLALARESRNCILSASLAAVDALPLLPPLAHSFASLRRSSSAAEATRGRSTLNAIKRDNKKVTLSHQEKMAQLRDQRKVAQESGNIDEAERIHNEMQEEVRRHLARSAEFESAKGNDELAETFDAEAQKPSSNEIPAREGFSSRRNAPSNPEAEIEISSQDKPSTPERLDNVFSDQINTTSSENQEVITEFLRSPGWREAIPSSQRNDVARSLERFFESGGTLAFLDETGEFGRFDVGRGGSVEGLPVISLDRKLFAPGQEQRLTETLVHELDHFHRLERRTQRLRQINPNMSLEQARRAAVDRQTQSSVLDFERTAVLRAMSLGDVQAQSTEALVRATYPSQEQISRTLTNARRAGGRDLNLNNYHRQELRESLDEIALQLEDRRGWTGGEKVNLIELETVFDRLVGPILDEARLSSSLRDELRNEMLSYVARRLRLLPSSDRALNNGTTATRSVLSFDKEVSDFTQQYNQQGEGDSRTRSFLRHDTSESSQSVWEQVQGSVRRMLGRPQPENPSASGPTEGLRSRRLENFQTNFESRRGAILSSLPGAQRLNTQLFSQLSPSDQSSLLTQLEEFQSSGGRLRFRTDMNESGAFSLDSATDAPQIDLDESLLRNPEALQVTLRHELNHFRYNEFRSEELLRTNPGSSLGQARRQSLAEINSTGEGLRNFEAQAVGAQMQQMRTRLQALQENSQNLRSGLDENPGNINIIQELDRAEFQERAWRRYAQHSVLYPEQLSTRRLLQEVATQPRIAGSSLRPIQRQQLEGNIQQITNSLREDPLFQATGNNRGSRTLMELQFDEFFIIPLRTRLISEGATPAQVDPLLEELNAMFRAQFDPPR